MSLKKSAFLYGGFLASLCILGVLTWENWDGLSAAMINVHWGYLGLARGRA